MAKKRKYESTIGADFLELGNETRSKKTAIALGLSEAAPDPEPAPAPAATPAPAAAPAAPAAPDAAPVIKTEPDDLVSINIRLSRDMLQGIDVLAEEAGLLQAVYMRHVVMTLTDPAIDPELFRELLQIERDRPRSMEVLKARVNKNKGARGQMQGKNIRVPRGTAAKLQEMATARGLKVSLYLRYIFASLIERSSAAE